MKMTEQERSGEAMLPEKRLPFGPRPTTAPGWVSRFAKCVLMLVTALAVFPAALWLLALATELLDGLQEGSLLGHGAALAWLATFAMTALRLDGRAWAAWGFWGAAAAFAALAAAEIVSTGWPADSVGRLLTEAALAAVGIQVALHGLWSLCDALERGGMSNEHEA